MAFSKARRLGELVTTAGVLDQATVATASSGDNDTSPASTAFVTGAISDLADSAPSTLNTLNELAAALGDDANFSTTVTNSIATKLPLAGGTLTGNLAHAGDFTFDCGGDITLDAGGENIRFDLNGNEVGQIDLGSANFTIRTSQNGDIMFRGTPSGGSEIAMLTLDTSESGDATFSNDVYLANGKFLRWGDGSVRIYGDSTDGTELMTFVTGGTERMRISDNGFLKLSSKVSFSGTGDAGLGHHTNNYMYIYGGTAGLILQDNSGGSNRMLIRDSGSIEFEANGTRAMSIDVSGHIGMGNADASQATGVTSSGYTGACLQIKQTNTTNAGAQIRLTNGASGHTTSDGFFISKWSDLNTYYYEFEGNHLFYTGGTLRYTISSSGGANGSDEKWKEDIVDIPYGLDTVKALKPRKFKWKDSGEDSVGFIAQEVKPLIGEVISDPQEDGPPEADSGYTMNYSAMTAVLTKAIQEQQEQIETLKQEVEELKG